jgi:3'(2'), 5'-bisphosphate nucleotidase
MTELIFFQAIKATLHAGHAIMDIYDKDFTVEYKADQSPLTLADTYAHNIIMGSLKNFGLPLLSEEGALVPYDERCTWEEFWLVDPLDGTKDFVKRNGDFTVNIAVIKGQQPIAGVVYAPVKDLLYFGYPPFGSFRAQGIDLDSKRINSLEALMHASDQLPLANEGYCYTIVASKSHRNLETDAYIEEIASGKNNITYKEIGSSLKFCCMAEGSADLYPRLGPTMEWDTAAGHAIAILAGCNVLELESRKSLVYNKQSLLNPWFVVERPVKTI